MFFSRFSHIFTLLFFLTLAAAATSPALAKPSEFRLRLHHTEFKENLNLEDIIIEIDFGRKISARILGKMRLLNDENLTRYINLVGQSLVLHTNRPELTYYFAILDSDWINAFSAPGGYIFITLGAIKAMQNEAELAAVLAHELAHVLQRHIIKELKMYASDDSLTTGFSRLLSASTDTTKIAFSQVLDQALTILFNEGYKIKDEIEADQIATLLLANSGYDPAALPHYLEKIESMATEKQNKFSNSHPLSDTRLAEINYTLITQQLDNIKYPIYRQRFTRYVEIN